VTAQAVVRVLVVDDQPLIRAGLVALFSAAPGFESVGEAADGAEAVALVASTSPDVVLTDIRMPVMDGIEATRRILASVEAPHLAPRVVVLTTYDLDEYVYRALEAGAAGFLLKDTPPERILAAVRTVVEGDILVSPSITRRLIEAHALQHRATRATPALPDLDQLTPRETEVLRLVGNGLSNSEIADRFVLSEDTVKTHVKRIMAKLALSSRAQAVVVAYESGLIVAAPGRRDDASGLRDRQ
jgi:DNA-binding NarL/FixJ family response regulator